ncbi:diacylglycerol kinase [Microbulbifer sp. MLAF003]|uniref:diacylglycerol kinase n=1 Tax=Microbulbifer TaxID=48073 RepID=UPI000380D394|nr:MULTISPECIES: diacylglycerol kinase [Microbulbifer]WHI50869.1 diacylglycerol kinase [Microbulbifer sp. MLAF003]
MQKEVASKPEKSEGVANKPGKKGLARLIAAARYSSEGLAAAWRNEEAFRMEIILVIFIIPLAIWVGDTPAERAILIAVSLVVLPLELINSAIEATVDRISPEKHPLAKIAKDTGSAAVAVALISWLIVWGCIVIPKLPI